MKEIGEALKEQRENIGISIEEAADDLKLRPSQIEAIEAGDKEAFNDIFYLKYFIRDYSKYLGLNYEDMIDEFNEFLFDYTSKISIEDIKKAQKQAEVKQAKETKKIASPYTVETKRHFDLSPIIVYVVIFLVILGLGYYIISSFGSDDFENETSQSNTIGGQNESTK